MKNSNIDIQVIIDKYIAVDYTPEEITRLLSYLEQNDLQLFDQKTESQWIKILEQDVTVSQHEKEQSLQEVKRIIQQSPAIDITHLCQLGNPF